MRYTATFVGVAVTAQQDLFEITAPSGAAVRILAWSLGNETEIGDAQEEHLRILVNRGTSGTTSGSGGSAPGAVQIGKSGSTFGGAIEANNTTKMSGGAIIRQEAHAWNVRAPFQMIYTPEMCPIISPGDRLTIELASTPADSVTMSGTVWFEVIA